MAQFDETQFYICGGKSNMFNYKNKRYSIFMPIEQIVHMSENDCKNCETFGSWNGCIVMYCINCDPNGCGAAYYGQEKNKEHPLSATSTYLKDVDWSKIGDIYLEDSIAVQFINKKEQEEDDQEEEEDDQEEEEDDQEEEEDDQEEDEDE